jgi:hypothetical protein
MHIADFSVGMLGANGVVAAGIPIAVGAAQSIRIRGVDAIAVSFFGDGAINRGPFAEGLNWAASFSAAGAVRLRGQPVVGDHQDRCECRRARAPRRARRRTACRPRRSTAWTSRPSTAPRGGWSPRSAPAPARGCCTRRPTASRGTCRSTRPTYRDRPRSAALGDPLQRARQRLLARGAACGAGGRGGRRRARRDRPGVGLGRRGAVARGAGRLRAGPGPGRREV